MRFKNIVVSSSLSLIKNWVMLRIYFCMMVLMVSSCVRDRIKDENFATLDIRINISDKQEVSASHLYDEIIYIPLETTDESIISNVAVYRVTEDYIVVLQNEQAKRTLFIFNRKGKFINKIIGGSEGEGKIIGVYDFYVEGNAIEIADAYQGKILKFDINTGKLISADNIPLGLPFFAKFKESLYTFNTGYTPIDESKKEIYIINIPYKRVEASYLETPKYLIGFRVDIKPFSFEKFNDSYLYARVFDDKIYRVTEKGVNLYANVNFGSLFPTQAQLTQLTSDDPKESMDVINNPEITMGIRLISESEKSIFFQFPYQRNTYYVFYDKSTKETKIFYIDRKKAANPNDFNGGKMPLLFRCQYKNYLGYLMQPYDLKDHISNMEQRLSRESYNKIYGLNNAHVEMVNKLSNIDNPVLVMAKLKASLH